MNKIIVTLSVLVLSINGLAQNKENTIDEVNLQGRFLSIPYNDVNENVTVITKQQIQNSPATSIDELLQFHSGLDIKRRGSNGVQSDITIRGSSFEQVLILVNGIRMNDSQTGHNTFNLPFDISAVERVEIMKGSSAKLYGQNVYAGVINIVTKSSSEEQVTIKAQGGDFKTYDLSASATFGSEKFTNLFTISNGASDGYRFNTDYQIRNFFYQNKLKLNDGSLSLQAGFSEKKFGANGFYASPAAINQYEETQASVVSLQYQQRFDKLSVNSSVYWRRGQDMYLYTRQNPAGYRNMHIGNNVGGTVNATYESSLGTTGIGVDYRKEFLVSSNLGDRERDVTQVFFDHQFKFFDQKLEINPGASWANYSGQNFFYPGMDVGYIFNPNHKVFGAVSKGFRIPTFTDLYYVSPAEIGNPNLVPESAVSSELGYRFQNEKILAKVSGFIRNTNNGIDWLKETPESPWKAENVGKIHLKGFETEFKHQLFSFLNYRLGYTYLDNQYKNEELSRYALQNLRHQFVAQVDVKFLKFFSNQLIYKYSERVNLGSYNVLDEQINFRYKDLNFYVLINNLTNAKYVETNLVPMPGRWFHVGFTYQIKMN
ncbi:TonB-dependent receptor [Epilithonimonas ginsengisoli]|uniref:TonB-dependent receptor n=1 Tax=Epilithonimonas ginsengisoli TaxID=1245592 RepID=A0ABU4JF54_9FLAO|nr:MULTISPECIES: TonB-dependent receptor [Chryseobacterium group]MBV6879615.1 TonB-dependent receptor [Epilithonimonas sp. FP105]MDW8548252.1 TonB-dependent receptor [Epilithonimonas ginsengisoli]OAH69763.1 TonB-dependent receptor [Chryseobacterium sp. FP211-J200]